MRPTKALILLPIILAEACLVGPNYHRPSTAVPPAYKEAAPAAEKVAWKPAEPRDVAGRGKWWEIFSDPVLNGLEEQVAVSNQTIAQAEAQYRSARALVRGVRANLFPTITAEGTASRSSGVYTSSPGAGQAAPATPMYDVPVEASWEIDLFGKIRRGLQAQAATAQASAADLEAVRLSMHAELAAEYFLLRGLDAQIDLLNKTVAAYKTTLVLTQNRYKQGIVSGVDVAQAKTQFNSTMAQATDLGTARAQAEHAIAVLVGRAPQEFGLEPSKSQNQPPVIPVGLPSGLLERRPDIAASERLVAAANAKIGAAVAAYFPSLSLTGYGEYQGSPLSVLFTLPNRAWYLGASLAGTIFDGGARRSARQQAVANHDAAVAAYRQTVLSAFQQVEDNLVALRVMTEEATYRNEAAAQADLALKLANSRYMNGVTSYLEVVTAQATALSNELTAVELLTKRLTASLNLIKALGGDWPAPK